MLIKSSYFTLGAFLLASTVSFAQQAGEKITCNPEKGIYQVRYWSIADSTFYEVPLFPGNKAKPVVEAYVSLDPSTDAYKYHYKLSNKEEAVRELYTFSVTTPSSVSKVKIPNEEWRGRYLAWMKAVRWTQTNSRSDTLGTLPGEKVKGEFAFTSTELPGIVEAVASSYHNLGNTPDEGPSGKMRMLTDSLLRSTKNITLQTLGPRKLPAHVRPSALLDTLHSYLSFSCDTTWIPNSGTCRSLEVKLDGVQRQLRRGDNEAAANSLRAFLNELEALNEEQFSSEAYGLLYYNGRYLLDKLN